LLLPDLGQLLLDPALVLLELGQLGVLGQDRRRGRVDVRLDVEELPKDVLEDNLVLREKRFSVSQQKRP
jgi:hypothetical protein